MPFVCFWLVGWLISGAPTGCPLKCSLQIFVRRNFFFIFRHVFSKYAVELDKHSGFVFFRQDSSKMSEEEFIKQLQEIGKYDNYKDTTFYRYFSVIHVLLKTSLHDLLGCLFCISLRCIYVSH